MSKKGRLNIINRDEYKAFQNSPITEFKMDRRITNVIIERVSHDEEYAELKKKGLQIDITNTEVLVNGKRPMDGIFSPLFGADTTQEIPLYSCECHNLTGGSNLGRTCPECGTTCRSLEADLSLCGYIDIAPYHVLTYHGFNAFTKLFNKHIMEEIITKTKKINVRGKTVPDGKATLMSLYEDFDEKYADLIDIDKKYLFTTKIPVYSARLRPLMKQNARMTILDVNKKYLSILKDREVLLAAPVLGLTRDVEVHSTLNDVQQNLCGIFEIIEDQIDEKAGIFRKMLAAGRLDFSARLVISLNTTLMAHEIDIPYSTMTCLFEAEIVNYLSRLESISRQKAIDILKANMYHRDDRIVKVIKRILNKKEGCWALVNRNPTISESSILYMRIRNIHDDPEDVTLHLSADILPLLAADFDRRGYNVSLSHRIGICG